MMRTIYTMVLGLFVLAPALTWGQGSYNRQTTEVLLEAQTVEGNIDGMPSAQKNISDAYFDGLGRPLQTIARAATATDGTAKDLIGFYLYSQTGTGPKSYLPYANSATGGAYQSNPLAAQTAFYGPSSTDGVANDSHPFVQSLVDKSPLGMVEEIGGLGAAWQPGAASTKVEQRSNNANEVMYWTNTGTRSGFYAVDQLWMSESTDENGHKSKVYTDKLGRTIMTGRQLDEKIQDEANVTAYELTYYIYDKYNRLSHIVPPQAIAEMQKTANWSLGVPLVASLVYQYTYDELDRLVEQKVPGAGISYIVYDNLNRPVHTQDAELRNTNKWNFVKYDRYGRVAFSGVRTETVVGRQSRTGMQNYFKSLDYAGTEPYFEERSSASASLYYTFATQPVVSTAEVLSVNYYDRYDLALNGTNTYNFVAQTEYNANQPVAATAIRGLPAIVWKKHLGTSTWLKEAYFYDKFGRIVQVRKNNHLSTAINQTSGGDFLTMRYDFSGKLLNTLQKQTINGSSYTTVLKSFEYYPSGHLKGVTQKNNGGTEQRVANYKYNEMGQLTEKNLHYKGAGTTTAASSYLQSVDYKYNIKGWLTHINNSALSAEAGGEVADIFGMELFYNTSAGLDSANVPQYNGNISAVKWKSSNTGSTANANPQRERAYRYGYDKQDRLKSAKYAAKATTWNQELGAYNVEGIAYDHNGNILKLDRYDKVDNASARRKIDALGYAYSGNLLTAVADAALDTEGFVEGATVANEYTYNANGSLTKDDNKGITSITYNELGKVNRITKANGHYIQYAYDATGTRIQKKVVAASTVTTDYIDGMVYENGTLSWFGMPEGRVVETGGTFEYQYIVSDNQGNSRIMFRPKPSAPTTVEVLQENHYDPYGLPLTGVAIGTNMGSAPNQYLYNGPGEWEADLGTNYHNTHFRDYDPILGRFNGVDPLASSFAGQTPYNYSGNNPVNFNDPLGDYYYQEPEWETVYNYESFRNVDGPVYSGGGGMLRDGIVWNIGRDYSGGAFGISPISGNNWSNYVFGSGYNASLMSQSQFWEHYGINEGNRADFAKEVGVNSTVNELYAEMAKGRGERLFTYFDGRYFQIVDERVVIPGTNTPLFGFVQPDQNGGSDGKPMIDGVQGPWSPEAQQAGLGDDDLLGPGLIGLGARLKVLKPVGALGSQPGSSIASSTLSKVLPVKMPFRVANTTNLGRMLGRTLPFTAVGVVLTAFAIEDAFREISPTFDFIIGMRDYKMGIRD